jgi:hypothetical protein
LNLFGIRSDDVPRLWPILEPLVESALVNSGGRYDAPFVLTALRAKDLQAWVVAEGLDCLPAALVLTEVRCYPTGLKALNLFGVAGKGLAHWKHLTRVLEQYATESGCGLMEGCGRDGWGRAMGWTEVYRVVERRLV